MSWFMTALKKYATFSGRSRRSEYWYFTLFYLLIYVVLMVVDMAMGTFSTKEGVGLLTALFSLAMLLPSVGVTVRRLHDTGHSGWWILIGFIPLLGALILLAFLVRDSDAGTNRYGENPKTPFADAVQVFS
jgi:uncharacterized membrane protein YhaH (DUF805 family)